MTTLDLTAGDKQAGRSERLAQGTRVLCVLFFFPGFPALIYQLAWQRALFRIFGVNIESVTIVVTAFMLGLGIGSLAGGWLSKRPAHCRCCCCSRPSRLLTGAFGLVLARRLRKVGELDARTAAAGDRGRDLALVIVPTLLMGATLPLLVGHLVRRRQRRKRRRARSTTSIRWAPAPPASPARCCCFRSSACSGAIYVAVAINAAVAIGALAAHWSRAPRSGRRS